VFTLALYIALLTPCILTGMMLNEEKWARLAGALARRQRVPGAAGASAPPTPISAAIAISPTPSAPIAAVPLATV